LRWLLVILGMTATMLQVQLWLSDDGYRKTLNLRTAVADQRAQNQSLRERNAALDAEVINLKQGLEAAEERARTDLGMIGSKETFYQVVPVVDASD
jgi:cell division protein FtsB